jgi:hypothetical protein
VNGYKESIEKTGSGRRATRRSGYGRAAEFVEVGIMAPDQLKNIVPEWMDDFREAERLYEEKQLDEAEARLRVILERDSEAALAYQLLGLIHVDRFELDEAMQRLHQALALRSNLAVAHNSLGHCHVLLGNERQALTHFHRALCLEPQHVLAHYNRSVVWLKRGRLREGWVEHEWRFAAGVAKRQMVSRPLWDGSSLENLAILVYTEQGLGDVLQFARFLPLLRRRAKRLLVACHHPLRPFLESLGCIDDWFPVDRPHEITFDVYTAMMSVPALLRINERTIPRTVPYLFAEPARVEVWRQPVRKLPGLKVGVCWQGNPLFRVDRYRSIPLRYYAPLAAVPGVTLISLQHGAGLEQVEANRERVPLTFLPELDRDGVFLDRAAVMQHLDLVITSDTSAAHLAGGLGRPVWLALAANCDWRWQHDRTDSPWYPTMRLFRQRTIGDWEPVFAAMAEALRNLLARRSPEREPPILTMSPGELLDRIAQFSRTNDDAAAGELTRLQALRRRCVPITPEVEEILAELEALHKKRDELDERLRGWEGSGNLLVEQIRRRNRIEAVRDVLIQRINAAVGNEVIPSPA